MVQVDPTRAAMFDRHRDELARRFTAGGDPAPDRDGRVFRQVQRADLLRAA
jgi:hypothetical protein